MISVNQIEKYCLRVFHNAQKSYKMKGRIIMRKSEIAALRAFEYHESGFHCAEAVFKAILETYETKSHQDMPGLASAFGGGVGKTHQEMCGALAGAFIAIGGLLGRNQPGADWSEVSDMATELRRRFMEIHQTTQCSALLEKFGTQIKKSRCKKLSGEVAGMLADLLEERRKD
jgi:C_GCAxxG_C_C family probable redox protein